MHACTGPELGTSAAPPELGLGGGMCWAALDRYLRGVEVPRDVQNPDPGDPLHTELVGRQVAALAGQWARISEWQSAPAGSWRDRLPLPIPGAGDDVASRVRSEWRGLRRRLDAGEPVLLTLLLEAGGYDRVRTVRQVLATDWSRNGWRVTISIYDPDQPDNDDLDLLFSLAGPLNARLTGGVPIRGFIPVSYDRTPAPIIRTERFDDRSVIGLNRPVRGRPATAAGRKHVDLVARNERGDLIHFRRRKGGIWEGRNVSDSDEVDVEELHSDPAALHHAGALHVFARNYAGDLLHLSQRRGWSVTNCTDQKRAGPQFRLAGAPIPLAGSKLQLSVLGRDSRGGVIHYHYAPLRGWRAEQVPGDPVACDPIAVRHEDTTHVIALGDDGRLLHWSRDDTWTMTDPEAGPGPTVRLQGRPTLRIVDGRPHVIGRGRHNRLLLLRLGDDGLWARKAIAGNLGGDPAAAIGPGGLHVLAPTADGELIHAWEDADGWTWENVVESRPTLAAGAPGEAEIACWGSDASLRAFIRCGSRLRAYTWTPDADWVTDPVSARAGTPPAAFRDSRGDPHLVFTDGRGTLVHVETGPWTDPHPRSKGGQKLVIAGAAANRARAEEEAEAREEAADQGEAEAQEELQAEEGQPEAEALEPIETVGAGTLLHDEPTDAEPVADAEPDPLPDEEPDAAELWEAPELEAADGSEEPWPEPGTASEAGTEPEPIELELPDGPEPTDHTEVGDEPAEMLEFEAERRMAEPVDPDPEPQDPDPEPGDLDPEPAVPDPEPIDDPAPVAVDAEHDGEAGEADPEESQRSEEPEESDVPEELVAEAASPEPEPVPGREPETDDPEWDDQEEWDSRPPAGLPGLPNVESSDADPDAEDWEPQLDVAEEKAGSDQDEQRPTERPVRKFRWEQKPTPAPEDVEPMDLSLLNTWPPPSRSARRERSKDQEPSNRNGKGGQED